MRTHILLLASAAVLLSITACNKDDDGGGGAPAPTSSSSLSDLFAHHIAQETQTFTISATAGGLVTGAAGTRIFFPANGFRDANGNSVSGTVQVDLLEALTIGRMIWTNTQTVGDDYGTDRLLRSGGEIRVAASQNGNALQLGPSGMTVLVPTADPDANMGLFTANEPRDSGMVWTPVDSSQVNLVEDTIFGGGLYYEFQTDSLQWINCDYFGGYPNTTNLAATIPDGQPADSTAIWIGFPTENAVMNLWNSEAQTYTTWQVVPIGMQATVVGLYRNGTQYYSAFSTVTITDLMNVPLTFTPTTLTQFEQDIDGI
jgi:hypothetical protein